MINQSRRDEMILALAHNIFIIPKGWHDWRNGYDTPSGFINLAAVSINLSPLRGLVG